MSAMDISEEMTDSDMLKVLDDIYKDKGDVVSESNMKQLVRVTLNLSRILPKVSDSSIYDVDDIIYQNDHITGSNSLIFGSIESSKPVNTDCVNSFLDTYAKVIDKGQQQKTIYSMDMLCLQVAEYSPKEIEDHENFFLNVMLFICKMMMMRRLDAICLSLKMMKLSLTKSREIMLKMFQGNMYYNYPVVMVQKLLNIPQARLPRQRKITSWLSQQVSYILEIIDMKSFKLHYKVKKYFPDEDVSQLEARNKELLLSGQQLDIEYLIRRQCCHPTAYLAFHCDDLYSFFMTTKGKEERMQRIKELFRTPMKIWNCRSTKHLIFFGDRLVCDPFVDINLLIMSKALICPDDVMRAMEKLYGCEIEDYLSGDKINTNEVLGDVRSELKDNGKNSQIPWNEEDYTFENYLFYDSFKKQLQLMNIFHSACMICQELLGIEGDAFSLDSCVFRGERNCLITYTKEALVNPEKRGSLPWIIEVVSKLCPYIILPKTYEYLWCDLLRRLKGEEIDEYTEEEIYFAICCVHRK